MNTWITVSVGRRGFGAVAPAEVYTRMLVGKGELPLPHHVGRLVGHGWL